MNEVFKIIQPPPVVCELLLVAGSRDVVIVLSHCPNRWHRFWQRALLGFQYVVLADKM